MRLTILVAILVFTKTVFGQVTDTNTIKNMVSHAIVLYPDKTDSIYYYANYIHQASAAISFAYGETYSYRLMGSYYRFNDNFDSAIFYYQVFLQKAHQHGFKLAEWLGTIDIANVYMNIGQYAYAKKLYFNSLYFTPQITPIPTNYSHLYSALASCYKYLNMPDSAKHYYVEAIRYDLLANDSTRMMERKSNLAEVLLNINKLDEAEQLLKESYAYNKKNNIVDALWYNYYNMGKLFMLREDYAQSEKYYTYALRQSEKTSTPFKTTDALIGLSELYRKKRNFKKSLEFKLKSDSIIWATDNQKRVKDFILLEEKHKAAKKEKENYGLFRDLEKEVLKKQNLTIIIIALVIIVIGIAFVLRSNIKKKNILAVQNNIINKQKEKLTELNTEKNTLISYVSHDLGSPLVNIILSSQTLERNLLHAGSIEERMQLIKNINESAEYGYDLIQKILNIEAVETGSHKLEMTNISLTLLIDELRLHFNEIAKAKQINIIVESALPKAILFTDKKLLRRILENILSNAIKYSEPAKNIWIKTYQDNHGIGIKIKDEGPGIPDAEKEKLFLRYTRLDKNNNTAEKGMGLGLFIVKRLADELNAKIKVESQPGMGSTFSVYIPT